MAVGRNAEVPDQHWLGTLKGPMNMTDLWTEVSRDDEAERTQRYLLAARVRTSHLVPLLAQATSAADYTNRLALVADRMESAVAEAVGEDYDYYGRTHAALLAELREDWELVRSAQKNASNQSGGTIGRVAWKIPPGTPEEEASAYRNYVGQMAADSDAAYFAPIDFASWRRSYWDDSKGAPTYAPGLPPMASSRKVAVYEEFQVQGTCPCGQPIGPVTIKWDGQEVFCPKCGKRVGGDSLSIIGSRHPFDEGGSTLASGLPKEAIAWKEQAGYGWYVNPADTGNALWARITGTEGSYMLTVYRADGSDTEAASVVVEQGPLQTLEQAKDGANYLVTSGAKTASDDLDAEWNARYWSDRARHQENINAAVAEMRAMKGKEIVVTRGRKIPIGTRGTAFWVGEGNWGWRVGFTGTDGVEYWTDIRNVEVASEVTASKTASFTFVPVTDAQAAEFVAKAAAIGYTVSNDEAHDLLLLNGGYERAMESAGIRADAYGYDSGFAISEIIETTDGYLPVHFGASDADIQRLLGALRTEEQRRSLTDSLGFREGSKVALDLGEDGHEHKLKHLYVDHGGNDNVTFAECTICGEVFVASPEYTNGEFVPRMPVAASKVAVDKPGPNDPPTHNCVKCGDRLPNTAGDLCAFCAEQKKNSSKVAADYKYNSAIRALYLKDGTFIADVMGTDPDIENPAGPTWVGFDADGNRRKWKAADIDRIHDAEYALQTSWVDEQMDKQGGYTRDPYRGGDGQMYAVHTTGPNDTSPVHDMSDYNARCGWCYLNASHSEDAHAEGVATGVEPYTDAQGLVASFSAGYEAGWTAAKVARIRTASLNETLEDAGYLKGVQAYWKAAEVGFEGYTPWTVDYAQAWNATYQQALQSGKSHAEATAEADRVNGEPILAAASKTAESNPYDGDSGSNPFAVDRPAAPAPKGPGTPDDALDGPATPEPVRVPTTTRPRGGEQIDMTPPPPAQPMMVTPVDPNQQVAAAKIDLQDPAVRSKILAIARSVTETNSGISWQEARDVAVRTVKAFPRMVQR